MASSKTARVIAMFLLLAGTFISGTLPILLIKKLQASSTQQPRDGASLASGRNAMVIAFLVCFGGGVLFATCFIHLLPEVREAFEHQNEQEHLLPNGSSPQTLKSQAHKHDHKLPLPEMMVCVGFFTVYFLEEFIHAIIQYARKKQLCGCGEHVDVIPHGNSHSHSVFTSNRDDEETRTVGSESRVITKLSSTSSAPQDYGSTSVVIEDQKENATDDRTHATDQKMAVSLNGLLMVLALSFHSVFEGLAIGLQGSDKAVWTMFAAVSMHKVVIAFVVGFEVYEKGRQTLVTVTYMTVFSFMSPVGILIGILTESSFSSDSNPVVIYLTAISTGTLLYVTFFEILQSEKNKNVIPGLLQFFATILGFILMLLFTAFLHD